MHPQIQFKAGFFGTFQFISIILCYGHFIHAVDTPGDAECISGMSQNLESHRAKNMLQAEMKACVLSQVTSQTFMQLQG